MSLLIAQSSNIARSSPAVAAESKPAALPRLVEFGSGKCLACKRMAPIIESLKSEYAGRLKVETVDVFADRAAAAAHSIRLIPCQVFLDPSGKEIFRHTGFIPGEDILAKWKALGYDLAKPAP